jgi:hypothetical protein
MSTTIGYTHLAPTILRETMRLLDRRVTTVDRLMARRRHMKKAGGVDNP